MPISNNTDFNNISVALETKLPIYLLLLECTKLTMCASLNCPTENTFALQMLDLILWGGGRERCCKCLITVVILFGASVIPVKPVGSGNSVFCLNPSYATVEGSLSHFHIFIQYIRVTMHLMQHCCEDYRYCINVALWSILSLS